MDLNQLLRPGAAGGNENGELVFPKDKIKTVGSLYFLDPNGYPAIVPPWGTLNAIDMNTGKYLWKIPFGEYPELAAKGMHDTGSQNYAEDRSLLRVACSLSNPQPFTITNFMHSMRGRANCSGRLHCLMVQMQHRRLI